MSHAVKFLQTALPDSKEVSVAVDESLAEGNLLADALKPFLKLDLYYQLRLAERHGKLPETIEQMGQFMEARVNQRQKLVALLQYPCLLLILLLAMFIALQIFVFPEIQSWQSNEGQSLGWLKWAVMVALCILLTLVASLLGWLIRFFRSSLVQRVNMLCKLPVFGSSFQLYYCYYVLSNVAMMVNHGLSLAEIGQVTAAFHTKSLLYHIGQSISRAGQKGEGLSTIISTYRFIPKELPLLLEKGQTLEKLGQDLTAFANIQFQRLLGSIERLLTFVQPLLFVVVALIIVGMYLSILLPIYHSLQGVY